jgi:type I restriction enzyme, S subunit
LNNTKYFRWVTALARRLSVVDELEAVVSANLQRAARLRQSILQRVFAGKLVAPKPGLTL